MARRKNRTRAQRKRQGYYIQIAGLAEPFELSQREWLTYVFCGFTAPERDGSRYAVPRHGYEIYLEHGRPRFYTRGSYGPGLMTNAKIIDAYLSSYCHLAPETQQTLIVEDYDIWRLIEPEMQPTVEENQASLDSVAPLRDWLRARVA